METIEDSADGGTVTYDQFMDDNQDEGNGDNDRKTLTGVTSENFAQLF